MLEPSASYAIPLFQKSFLIMPEEAVTESPKEKEKVAACIIRRATEGEDST